MSMLKSTALLLCAAYAALLLALFVAQRRMMYFPDTGRIAPALAGLPRAEAHDIRTADGETLVAWRVLPQPGRPMFLYFHGNAGQLANRAERFTRLTRDGAGLLAVSYRGYGGSTGAPTEAGLIADARAGYAFLRAANIAPERIVLLGESLGSGVAVALAAEEKVAAIVLEAPFSSAVDVAADIYRIFPVRWLMHDQFRSDMRIARVNAPVLIVHGTADPVVPIRFGERLFARANQPKTFLRVEGAGHQPLDDEATLEQVKAWLAIHAPPS